MVIGILVALGVALYGFSGGILAALQSGVSSRGVRFVTFRVDVATAEYNADTNVFTVCAHVRNLSSVPVDANGFLVVLSEDSVVVASETVETNCGELGAGDVCRVCQDFNVPEGEYTVSVSGGGSSATTEVILDIPPPPAYPSADLSVVIISVDQGRYPVSAVLHGDYNNFTVDFNVCNTGPNVSGGYTVSFDANGASPPTNLQDSAVSPGECRGYSVTFSTTSYSDGNVSVSISYPGDTNAANDSDVSSFSVVAYFECNSCSECSSELSSARDLAMEAYVVLTASATRSSNCISLSGDYSKVTFDGNGNAISASSSTSNVYAVSASSAHGLTLKRIVLDANSYPYSKYAVRLYYSDIILEDVNVLLSAGSSFLYFDGESPSESGFYISSATNSYCIVSGESNPRPILSFGGDHNGQDISSLIPGDACHVSVHNTNGVRIHDVNLTLMGECALLLFYNSSNLELNNVHITGKDGAIFLDSSTATVRNVDVSSSDDTALYATYSSFSAEGLSVGCNDERCVFLWFSDANISALSVYKYYPSSTVNFCVYMSSSDVNMNRSNVDCPYTAVYVREGSVYIYDSNVASNGSSSSAIYVSSYGKAYVKNSVLRSPAKGIFLASGDVSYRGLWIYDSNVYGSPPIYMSSDSPIHEANNSFCYEYGGTTPFPIVAFDSVSGDVSSQIPDGNICLLSFYNSNAQIRDKNILVPGLSSAALHMTHSNVDVQNVRIGATGSAQAVQLYVASVDANLTTADSRFCSRDSSAFYIGTASSIACTGCSDHNFLWYGSESAPPSGFSCSCAYKTADFNTCMYG
ncbi:MAG: hypothetical protein PWP76_770 [Candidatus Diapherotrites archaeon]|nr:hypothetical protein [Candidatus Diapherotrites archaeon]MDN5367132.1 hypothetical protein [Candidatus Diapherotrites archaeon]